MSVAIRQTPSAASARWMSPGHGLLHDAALVVLLLGPRVGEEGPYLGHGAGRGHLEQLGRIDLGHANVGQPLLAGEQQRVGHAGVIDL